MKKILILLAVVASLAVAQEVNTQDGNQSVSKTQARGQKSEFKTSNSLQWGPPPPGIPAAAQAAVLMGDPTKAESFIVRLKAPAGARIMPHWHPTDENVTLISGDFAIGMGDKLDETAAHKMAPGDFVSLKARDHHYAIARSESVVQMEAMGPFQITYVNPSDDPRNQK